MQPPAIELKDPVLAHPDRLYIGGAWVAAHSGRTISQISPNTEEVVSTVAEADEVDMDAAVAAARDAFDNGPWGRMQPAERIGYMKAMSAHLHARVGEVARAWTLQMGGLASFAGPMQMGSNMTFDNIIAMAEAFQFVEQRPTTGAAVGLIAYEPVGVVAAIAPWNGPYGIMLNKVAYSLAAGCTVIMKPSPETAIEAYIIAEAAQAAGVPAGVVNLVCGHREASDHLVCNPGVDKVSFTGSTVAGKRIAEVCGSRIARCTLELGGKSAGIVLDDFPVEIAAKLITGTICMMSGQVCAMLSRILVSRARHDELAAAIAAEMAQVKIGYSDDPSTMLGPVAMKRQLERIEMYIEEGKKTATLVCGGKRPAHLTKGYFIEPTLFANVDNASRIAQEEIFGPVLCLIPYDTEEDAIRIANDSAFGLNGSVITNDAEAAYRIARRIRSGAVGQNGLRMDFGLPFGGFKQSGVGREGGLEGLLGYLESKTILIDGMPAQL
ncbi:aldehyde dehydrogenase family protein [Novosphingobium sp. FSY-8]|uniref:Aldehyde dehydrogenase family protein n=1 Tax=Novosphingobium ovatum TaxID=1908523 RepID=A0ABW9XDH8_9SPHN|nr:aldehyde dehydrogenase [Novosphingobium ovatum]NBC36578.1 aldehyde dehydrogenase family protein [Novosphingobium ovatum]